ncbi:ABC transporter permease [Haloferula sp. BvORR071]|uniref:ABC transporter permease n=1 Tax=Haloferula sp. BvORR071 TaxID=1396141 RepID=UPI00054CDCC2|nr:ABC transporter permease [Haloferula sp. BvORR071]
MKKELGIFILLVVLCTVTATINPRFLSAANLTNMANVIGLFGVFSLGLGLVIITSGIDLSVGSMCALTGVVLAMALTEWHWAWPLAALAVLAIPMLLGWAHGALITRMKMQPFIVTLCGLLLYRGVARFIAGDSTKGFGEGASFDTLRQIASGKLMGLPMPFVILLVTGSILWVVLHRSVYGRYLFAVGRNEEAARFSGINTNLVITVAYVVAGLLTGVSGIMIAFYTNSVAPSNHGNFYELYGIAAAVLGGCSLRGGEGSIIGIIIGTALLQVLQNLVNLLGIPSSLNFAVMGAVVLIGALADQWVRMKASRRVTS